MAVVCGGSTKRLGLALLDVRSTRTSRRQASQGANVSHTRHRVDRSQNEVAMACDIEPRQGQSPMGHRLSEALS
jgi:hypothetical protein